MEHVVTSVLENELHCPTLFAHTNTDEACAQLEVIKKQDKLNITIVGSASAYDINRITRVINALIRPFKDRDALRIIYYDNNELAYIIKKWGEFNKIETVAYDIENEFKLNSVDDESPGYWRNKKLHEKALVRRDQRVFNDTHVLIYLQQEGSYDKAIDTMYNKAIDSGKFVTRRIVKGTSHGIKKQKKG